MSLARTWGVVVVGAALLIAVAMVVPSLIDGQQTVADYLAVAGLSGLVAYGELVSRYRDSPVQLFRFSPTPLYLLVNIAAGVAALAIVTRNGAAASALPSRLDRILLAGFGSIAFFRTALFTARIGGQDVGIGPSAVLSAILTAIDVTIDRDQATQRGTDVRAIMPRVSFGAARIALPSLCFALVERTVSAEEQRAARSAIDNLAATPDTEIDLTAKSLILGAFLVRLVGREVLAQAVDMLARPTAPRAD